MTGPSASGVFDGDLAWRLNHAWYPSGMRVLFIITDPPICPYASGGLMSLSHIPRYGGTPRASPPPQLYAIVKHDQLRKTEMDTFYGMSLECIMRWSFGDEHRFQFLGRTRA